MRTAEDILTNVMRGSFDHEYDLVVFLDEHKQELINAIQTYASEACKEQREICADHYNHFTTDTNVSILFKIKNAPEPELK